MPPPPPLLILSILLLSTPLHGAPPDSATPQEPPPISYSTHTLIRTSPIQTRNQQIALLALEGMQDLHFWKHPQTSSPSDILISPSKLPILLDVLSKLNLTYQVVIEDVGPLIEGEELQGRADDDLLLDGGEGSTYQSSSFFTTYQRYTSIINFCKQLAASNPSIVKYSEIGTSSEGRAIPFLTISDGSSSNSGASPKKKKIFLDGGMHAREWISPATALYIAGKLTKNPQILSKYTFLIAPLINPDGYEYTHTRDRMWRKTRSRTNSARCIGVDPNRNWNFHWAEAGASSDPCSDIYHGPRAFSEPETRAVAGEVLKNAKDGLAVYVTLHSYSQLWLIPFGYRRGARPADWEELVRVARAGASSLSSLYGTQYQIGTAPDILYPAAGGSDDWAKGVAGVKYVYTLELRDKGQYGFLLPAREIVPVGEETWRGLVGGVLGSI